MVKRGLFAAALSSALLFSAAFAKESAAAHPYPVHAEYRSSANLSKFSQSDLDRRVLEYYRGWKRRYLVREGDLYRVAMNLEDKRVSTSESIGYGMLVAAIFAGADSEAKEIFDGLYRFSRRHPSRICRELMSWKVPTKKGDADSAFDGDADIAYALLIADAQWGGDTGIAYKKEALKIIDAIYRCCVGEHSRLPLLGDWVDPEGELYNQYSARTSDFMLANFRAFYRSGERDGWLEVIEACREALLQIQNDRANRTLLVPDFIRFDKSTKRYAPAPRRFLESEDDSYYYNACRVPLRIGMDALFNGDETSRSIAVRMAGWVWYTSQKSAEGVKSGYRLDGTPIGDYFSPAFAAPLAVAAKCDASLGPMMDAIYEKIADRYDNYYEDTLSLISQLLLSNNFWDPSLFGRRDKSGSDADDREAEPPLDGPYRRNQDSENRE